MDYHLKLNELFQQLKSNSSFFIHTAVCSPVPLLHRLVNVIKEKKLSNIKFYHLHIEGDAPHVDPSVREQIQTNCFFVGSNCRAAVKEGRASYIPVFLSEIPKLFKEGIIHLDYALLSVSHPDQHNKVTLGPSVDVSLAAFQMAKTKIAMINKHLPRALGDGIIDIHEFNFVVEEDFVLPEVICKTPSEILKKLAQNVANIIPDRATLQLGIGEIPNAICEALTYHQNLGLHTEMFSDGIIPLVEKGIINNRFKKVFPNQIITSFAMGSKRLYSHINDNPIYQFKTSDFVNDPHIIAKNPSVCALNTALEVDLSGQVCADSIGSYIYSGVGGQVDFLRGASLSSGGKAIIALLSQTNKGISKIVSQLKIGSGVTSSRAHVQYVITEWGVVDLRGKSIKQRAIELINIAHPDHREHLTKEASALQWI